MAVNWGAFAYQAAREAWRDWRPFSPETRAKRQRRKAERKARRRAKRSGEEFTSELLPEDEPQEVSIMAYNKLYVVIAGALITFLSRWIPALEGANAEALVEAVLLALTALGVWAVPNKPAAK